MFTEVLCNNCIVAQEHDAIEACNTLLISINAEEHLDIDGRRAVLEFIFNVQFR